VHTLASIVDAWSRRAVGWSMATHTRAGLVTAALDAANVRRPPASGLVHHYLSPPSTRAWRSDRACASPGSRRRWARSAIAATTPLPRASPPWPYLTIAKYPGPTPGDRAPSTAPRAGQDEARASVTDYIDVFYGRIRRHSSLGNLGPEKSEERYRSSPAVEAD